ncbi:MAG: porin [Deferrisomatales bacterium]
MRKAVVLGMAVAAVALLAAARPAHAAVDLLQRLVEKDIISEEERKELAKEQDVVSAHRGRSFSWATPDGAFRAELYGYGQVRYTFDDRDQGDNRSNFSVQRMRLGLRGNAFIKDLKYQLLLNVYSGDENRVSLFDWFADYTPLPELGLKAGHYKVPYAVQWNISAANLQFVERTTVDANFRFDRDTGVTVHGTFFSMLSYDVGVYNGEGTNKNNPDDGHLYVARLTLEPLGRYALAESDIARSKSPIVLLSAAFAQNNDVASHTRGNLNGRLTALGPSDVTSWNGFAGLKWMGASAQAEYHRRKIDPEDSTLDDETAVGFYAQGGYLVWKNKLEVAGRYEYFDPNDDLADNLRQEYGGAVSWFFAGHRNKLQADFFRINTQSRTADSANDNRLRVQYQLAF